MGNLYEASHQWARRPADERFETLRDRYDACKHYASSAVVAESEWRDLGVQEIDNNICLIGRGGKPAKLTHYAFGQLARTISAPAEYLRSLPTSLAVQAVTHGMASVDLSPRHLLLHKNGSYVTRCITSDRYNRVWNFNVVGHLGALTDYGWRIPPARPAKDDPRARPATAADILPGQEDFGLSVKVGDMIAPAGLYASDHDMFAFLVDPNRSVSIGDRALMRGVFVKNSEVGDGSLSFKFFCMDQVCGNHIVWGSQNVHEISVRHIGDDPMQKAISKFELVLKKYDDTAGEDEAMLLAARKKILGATKDEVIESIVNYAKTHSLPTLGVRRIQAAYDTAEKFESRYGNPRSLFAMVSGLTQNSQGDYADVRNDVDVQAGKLLQIAF